MADGKVIIKLVAPATYNVTNDVDFIEVDTSSGGLTTINLQKISPSGVRKTFYISDIGNNASVGNIIVVATGGNLINNAGMIVLNSNGIIAEIVIANTNRFIANLSTDVATSTDGHIIQNNGVPLPQRQYLDFLGSDFNVTDDALNNKTKVALANTQANQIPLWATEKEYLLNEEFDKGVIPSGWTSSVQGGGSAVTFTQPYESGVIGQVFLNATNSAINNRAGIRYANNFSYILNFLDCVSTKWVQQFKINTPATSIFQIGLGNTITPANVLALAPLTGFGNTIAIRYDPLNKTGENPSLITNFYVFTKKAGVGFSTFDTGIAPSGVWETFTFVYDFPVSPIVPQIRVYDKTNTLVVTINTFTNVPTIIPTGGISPMAFTGSGGFTTGATGQLRLGKFSLFRVWT